MTDPHIRRSEFLHGLDAMREMDIALYDEVINAMPPEHHQLIEQKGTWLPLHVDLQVHKHLVDKGGVDLVVDWARHSMQKSLDGPLLNPLLNGTIKLLGLNPQHLFVISTKVYGLFLQNCGTTRVLERRPNVMRVGFSGLPDVICDPQYTYVESFIGTYTAVIERCDMVPDVELAAFDREQGEAEIVAKWSSR